MKLRIPLLVLVILGMLTVLTACGGAAATPVAGKDIPVFEGASAVKEGASVIADTLVSTLKSSMSSASQKSEINLYTLPKDTDWTAVKDFYTKKLEGTDWKSQSSLTQETAAINTLGWSRGNTGKQQVLMVATTNDPLTSDTYLVVALFDE